MQADAPQRWLATCPRALAPVLLRELEGLGATEPAEQQAAVAFTGTRALMYRVCLWSRVANRVLLPLSSAGCEDADALYAAVSAIPWHRLLAAGSTIAVDFHGSNRAIRNTRFGAQRAKDAIVDVVRESGQAAPRIQLQQPDLHIVLRLQRDRVDIALDMVGESLHRRGYRQAAGEAPLKENLAAALLLRANWPALAAEGAALLDPMCGSATLLIEGALIAADQAPALGRGTFGFMAWQGHDPAQWQAIQADAEARARAGREAGLPEIRGYDADPRVVRRAQENIAAAGLEQWVRVSVKALGEVRKPTHRPLPLGLVITNPPYGERIGRKDALPQLYRRLGELLHTEFSGWQAAILAADLDLGRALGLRSHRQYQLFNGRLPVTLLLLDLTNNRLVDQSSVWNRTADLEADDSAAAPDEEGADSIATLPDPGAEMFANRLRKNQRKLSKWLKRTGYECYRLYDADMPEYAVAVDRYGDWLHVAEYKPPAQVDAAAAASRLQTVRNALPEATGVPASHIVFKQRERQRGKSQYQTRGRTRELLPVREGEARLLVNLHDYLDTGLFLDHRPLRLRLGAEARGRRFLNLFCYTGAATVHAALGGARETVSVDLSNSYLRWLAQNLAQNGLAETRNHIERADVLQWLRGGDSQFELILLDPPSFSNSSKIPGSFDVQRDHAGLLDLAMARLARDGVLYFSNNRRRFRLDAGVSERYACEDITSATLDPDFPRRPPAHRCWRITHAAAAD